MRNKKVIRISAMLLSAVILSTTIGYELHAESPKTSVEKNIDFEKGSEEILKVIDGNEHSVALETLTAEGKGVNGTTAFKINQLNDSWTTAYYQPDKEMFGTGAEYALPQNVQFSFKMYLKDDANESPASAVSFMPIANGNVANLHPGRFPYVNIRYANYYTWGHVDRIQLQTGTDSAADSVLKVQGDSLTTKDVTNQQTTSIEDATWYTVNCDYDWSKFVEDKIVTCKISISNTSGTFVDYTVKYTIQSEDFANLKAYGFGFKAGNSNTKECWIDNIKVTLVSEIASKSEPEENNTSKGGFIDFENDTKETLSIMNGNDASVDVATLIKDKMGVGGTKAFNINQVSDGWTTAYYQPDKTDYGTNVEYALPKNVKFSFKTYQEDNASLAPAPVVSFMPIVRTGAGIHPGRFPYVNIKYANYFTWGEVDRISLQTDTDSAADAILTAQGDEKIIKDVKNQKTTSIEDATWYTVNCDYDWSKFTEDKTVTCNISISNASGAFVNYTVRYTMKSDNIINQKAYGFGFKAGSTRECWIDNIAITMETIDSEGNSTIHAPNIPVKLNVKGATISTSNQTIKMGFDLSSAAEAIAARGETVQKYGAVLVAGTKTLAEMKKNAALFMDEDTENNPQSYMCTTRKESKLPDIYSVTITNSNSGDGYDNRGKRATAIVYVVTDKGIYYSEETINHSVMSVVKAIFNDTYLTDEGNVKNNSVVAGSPLEKALTASNTTYQALTEALIASPTTSEQRTLLLNVHFALNK